MGCRRHLHFSISFLLLVSIFHAEGRKLTQTTTNFNSTREKEEKTMWGGQIGSKPPRCERICGSCGHCEAIQVPTNPQIKTRIENSTKTNDDFDSNYKPMSWKCKCGNLIFNP